MIAGIGLLPLVAAMSLMASDEKMEPFNVTVAGQGWGIAFQSPPLARYAGRKNGKDFEFRAAGETGFNLSVFVEAPKGADDTHEACYQHYWPLAKRNPMIDQDSVKVVKSDDYVQVAYEIVVGEGDKALRVRNVNYYFAYKGRWTDVHVSLFPPKETDEGILQQFSESLKYQAFDKDVETATEAGKAD
jgi:hypothetical protein